MNPRPSPSGAIRRKIEQLLEQTPSMPTRFDWAARYRDADTPWDLGHAHPELTHRLASGELGEPGRAFVPGCGRAHDALALARAGWLVTAVDMVDLAATGAALAAVGGRLFLADALAFTPAEPVDLVFDHTFFCAIDPDQRAAWGQMAKRVLRPGGMLCSLVFPVGKPLELEGPPWRVGTEDVLQALPAGFTLVADEPVHQGIEKRQWGERWATFRLAAAGVSE